MRRRRRRPRVVVPLTSMGDIAFLLIIFFVLVSNFAKESGIPVTPPTSPDVDTLDESRIVVIVDEDNKIYLDGKQVSTPKALQNAVEARIKDATGADARTVMFRCDHAVGREVFEPVLEAIAEAGGMIAAIGEPEGAPRKE